MVWDVESLQQCSPCFLSPITQLTSLLVMQLVIHTLSPYRQEYHPFRTSTKHQVDTISSTFLYGISLPCSRNVNLTFFVLPGILSFSCRLVYGSNTNNWSSGCNQLLSMYCSVVPVMGQLTCIELLAHWAGMTVSCYIPELCPTVMDEQSFCFTW